MAKQKTTVGTINNETLAYTARGAMWKLGSCVDLRFDCIGTAAHVTMLSKMPVKPKLITEDERKQVIEGLVEIIGLAQQNKFKIKLADQDVHLAVERTLTKKLGDLGKKIHTCRSRKRSGLPTDLRPLCQRAIAPDLGRSIRLGCCTHCLWKEV